MVLIMGADVMKQGCAVKMSLVNALGEPGFWPVALPVEFIEMTAEQDPFTTLC